MFESLGEKLDGLWRKLQGQGRITESNIRNYSIFHRGGQLFAYFEYVGDDFEGDMARMAEDPETQRWWDWMMPMQEPLADRSEGEWWATMEEVFHLD